MNSKFLSINFILTVFGIVSAHTRVCNNKHVIETIPHDLPSGDVLTIERFNCSSTEITGQHPSKIAQEKRETFELNLRAASQCTIANCMCGVPCFFDECRAVTQTIQAAHCTQLAAQLTNTPGTVTIPANEGVGFILGSCEYTAFGSETLATQYCFDDMGVAATELFSVCGTQQGDCKATSGATTLFVDQISL